MRELSRRHPIGVYAGLVYLIALIVFAIPLLSSAGLGILPLELTGAAPFILLAGIELAVVAFIVTRWADGPAGTRDLRSRTFRFRVSPIWYLVAVTILPLSALLAAIVAQGTTPVTNLVTMPDVLASAGVGLVVAFLLVNWWEEVGWTGFVLHRLLGRMHPISASVVTTWFQGALHLPLVFIADGVTVGRVRPEEYPFYLVALFVLPIPVRIVLTWIYNASGRSLPIVGLTHAGLGIATGAAFLPAIAPGFQTAWVYAAFAVLAVVVLVLTRGQLGNQEQPNAVVAGAAA
ncbi:MAG: type II CAAX prenyl endopeptidase Rce1 family protein [Chloroflexota bacterium]